MIVEFDRVWECITLDDDIELVEDKFPSFEGLLSIGDVLLELLKCNGWSVNSGGK